MTIGEAGSLLRGPIGTLEQAVFEEAVRVLLDHRGGEAWIAGRPHVLRDPTRDDPGGWGMHQRPQCNLMSYHSCSYKGKMVFLFDADIEDLVTKGE